MADTTLTAKLARDVIAELLVDGGSPRAIVEAKGYRQVSDEGALGAAIVRLLAREAPLVARYRGGESKLFGVLVGQLMEDTGGKANAKLRASSSKKLAGLDAMPLFSRPDGRPATDVAPFRRIMPFIMPTRNESAVYFEQEIDLTRTPPFLDAASERVGKRATLAIRN